MRVRIPAFLGAKLYLKYYNCKCYYKLNTDTIPQAILDEIINYKCTCQECDICKYYYKGHCLYEDARALKKQSEYKRRLKAWIQENS